MKFSRAEIPDVIIIEPDVFSDERGYFFETFKQNDLNHFLGYEVKFCQDNESKSTNGVLRGLHYQEPPFAQAKLVRVIQGSVLDVAVDIRKDSSTFGKRVVIELNDQNKRQLFIPRGFAHGFLVLEDNTIINYKCDNFYNTNSERGIIFNDKDLNIDWESSIKDVILSAKDKTLPTLSEYLNEN